MEHDCNLYYKGNKPTTAKDFRKRQVVQSASTRRDLIKCTHDQGHLGRDQTYGALKDRYYWPKMYTDVLDYVSTLLKTFKIVIVLGPICDCTILRCMSLQMLQQSQVLHLG